MTLNFWKKEPVSLNSSEDVILVSENDFEPVNIMPIVSSDEEFMPHDVDGHLYTKISRAIVSIMVVLLPLLFFPFTTSPLELNKQLFLILLSGVALIFWLVDAISSGSFKWRPTEFIKPISVLALATLLAAVFSINWFQSLFGLANSLSDSLISGLSLVVVYLLIINLFDDRGKRLQMLLAVSLGLVLLYGILQFFELYLFKLSIAQTKFFNTIGSPNSLGIIAAISLPFLHKLRYDFPVVKYYWTKVFMVLAVVILVVLNWWILWTVAIAGMFAVVALDSLKSKGFKISKFILPLTIIVLGIFLMVVKFNLPIVKNRLPVEISPSYSLSTRIANSVFKERFIFGYGPEKFSLAFDRYGSHVLSNTSLLNLRFFDSTSEFFNLSIGGGMVMMLTVLFLIGFVAWHILKSCRSMIFEDSDNGVVAMLLALIVAMFMYPFNLSLMFIFYLVLGLVALILWGDKKYYFSIEKSPFLSLVSSLGFIGGLILVLVVSYFSFLIYFADFKYAKAIKEPDYQKRADILTQAIRWNGRNDDYYRTLSQVVLNLLSTELNKPKNDPQRGTKIQNYVSSSVAFAKRATEIEPRESLNWANLGNIYKSLLTIVDNVDKLAEDSFLKAAELRPGDPTYDYQIGSIYMTEGDLFLQIAASNPKDASKAKESAVEAYSKAETYFKKAVDISNNYGLAIYNLGVVYERVGKLQDAIKQLEKLAPFNSNQPGLMFELGLLYYRAGRKDDAFNQLQRAIMLAPDYANAHWYLALIYEERNDIPAAIEQLEKILSVEINKDNSTITAKLKELRSGRKAIPPGRVLDQRPLQ